VILKNHVLVKNALIAAQIFLSVHSRPRFALMFVIKRGYVWQICIIYGHSVLHLDAICTHDGFNKLGVINNIG